jgi:hypothetical protein
VLDPSLPNFSAQARISYYKQSFSYSIIPFDEADPMRFSQVAFSVTLVAAVSAGPISGDYNQRRAAAFALKNGQDAQALNQKFQSLSSSSPCSSGEQACVQGQLAQCVGGKFVMTPCASSLQCVALPLVNKPGTRYVPRIIIKQEFHRFRLKHIDTTALRVTPSKTRKRA